MVPIYDPYHCPCHNTDCERYCDCRPCVDFHHKQSRYPLTACERLAKQEGTLEGRYQEALR